MVYNDPLGRSTPPILEVLIDLSTDIEVPTADVNEKRVSPTFKETVGDVRIRPLIQIQSSSEKPKDAFVFVPYRSFYFWIDDRDGARPSVGPVTVA